MSLLRQPAAASEKERKAFRALPPLPRPLSERITREEVEGESLDLCLQQLYK